MFQLRQRTCIIGGILAAICSSSSAGVGASTGRLDPCSAPDLLSKGAGFYLGLAFWPGGTLDDWGPAIESETIAPGLSPCLLTPYSSTNATDATNITTSHQEYLIQQGIVFATYEAKVDRMTVLRGNATEQASLYALAAQASSGISTTSVVAFRGPYRSPARYFHSNDAGLTGGKGAVQELALVARADSGKLQSLQWNDMTCSHCGGIGTSRCLAAESSDGEQRSCAVDASCEASDNYTALSDPCLPAVYLGFAGSDTHYRTFQSGYQIRKLNSFSLAAFYRRAAKRVGGVYDTIGKGPLGNLGQDTDGSGGSAA